MIKIPREKWKLAFREKLKIGSFNKSWEDPGRQNHGKEREWQCKFYDNIIKLAFSLLSWFVKACNFQFLSECQLSLFSWFCLAKGIYFPLFLSMFLIFVEMKECTVFLVNLRTSTLGGRISRMWYFVTRWNVKIHSHPGNKGHIYCNIQVSASAAAETSISLMNYWFCVFVFCNVGWWGGLCWIEWPTLLLWPHNCDTRAVQTILHTSVIQALLGIFY